MALACTGYGPTTNGGTPGNEPGPAFEMTVVGQVVCPDIFATTCVRVRILNLGTAGDGTCRLIAGSTGPHGEFEIEGPQVVLNGGVPGSPVTKTVPWTKALPTDPNFYFGGTCSPGLRS
jgi:hypothetical protein